MRDFWKIFWKQQQQQQQLYIENMMPKMYVYYFWWIFGHVHSFMLLNAKIAHDALNNEEGLNDSHSGILSWKFKKNKNKITF